MWQSLHPMPYQDPCHPRVNLRKLLSHCFGKSFLRSWTIARSDTDAGTAFGSSFWQRGESWLAVLAATRTCRCGFAHLGQPPRGGGRRVGRSPVLGAYNRSTCCRCANAPTTFHAGGCLPAAWRFGEAKPRPIVDILCRSRRPFADATGPMHQRAGEKWTAEVYMQPTIPKSDRLLAQERITFRPMRRRCPRGSVPTRAPEGCPHAGRERWPA